jgi:hypothetical protein
MLSVAAVFGALEASVVGVVPTALLGGPLHWGCASRTPCPRITGRHVFSQSKEDVYIAQHFFCDQCAQKETRTFVELTEGASQQTPTKKGGSNAHMYEAAMGWDGLYIEGHPRLARQPASRSKGGHAAKAADVPHKAVRSVGKVRRVQMDAPLCATAAPDELEKAERQVAKELAAPHERSAASKCVPLGKLLRLAGLQHIHYMTVGRVQGGGPLAVLQEMDWTIPVHVLTVRLGTARRASRTIAAIPAPLRPSSARPSTTLAPPHTLTGAAADALCPVHCPPPSWLVTKLRLTARPPPTRATRSTR